MIINKHFDPFSVFSGQSEKQQVLRIFEITQHFQKCFTNYDRGTWVLGFLGTWVLGYLGSWVLGYLGSWVLGYLDIWVLEYLGTWVLGLYNKMRDTTGVATQHNLPFQGDKWVAWKNENVEYLTVCNRFSSIFHPVVWENNGLLSKIYWNDLGIIDQGLSRVRLTTLLISRLSFDHF